MIPRVFVVLLDGDESHAMRSISNKMAPKANPSIVVGC